MDHDKCQSLLADYAVMGLTQKAAAEVEAHLQGCEVCSAHMNAQIDLIELGREFQGSLRPANKPSLSARASAHARSLGRVWRNLAAIPLPVAAMLLAGVLFFPLYLIVVSIPSLRAELSQRSFQLARAVEQLNAREGSPQALRLPIRSGQTPNTLRLAGDSVRIRLAVAKPKAVEGWYVLDVRSTDGAYLTLKISAEVFVSLWDPVGGGVVITLPTDTIAPGEHELTLQKEGDSRLFRFPFVAVRD